MEKTIEELREENEKMRGLLMEILDGVEREELIKSNGVYAYYPLNVDLSFIEDVEEVIGKLEDSRQEEEDN
jgi:cobalamin-dependent methionine synthase I